MEILHQGHKETRREARAVVPWQDVNEHESEPRRLFHERAKPPSSTPAMCSTGVGVVEQRRDTSQIDVASEEQNTVVLVQQIRRQVVCTRGTQGVRSVSEMT